MARRPRPRREARSVLRWRWAFGAPAGAALGCLALLGTGLPACLLAPGGAAQVRALLGRALPGARRASPRGTASARRAAARGATASARRAEARGAKAKRRVALALDTPVRLTVSSPAVLLNHIADRYSTTPRILMEFIDNALDDAEGFYDGATNSYRRPVKVDVVIAQGGTSITVTDNCRGMTPDVMRRVTTHVGESMKRGQSFVNGQFGFGMQAFRACCRKLIVRSRTSPGTKPVEMTIDRDQSSGFVLQEVFERRGPRSASMPPTGTMIGLHDIDPVWRSGDNELSLDAIAEEIEIHFERLLSRGNLEVAVSSGTGQRHLCKPVAYADPELDVVINGTIDLGGGQVAHTLLVVGDIGKADELKRPARFFVKGRRIGKTAEIRSFFTRSKHRWTVWNNPQVMGFMDVLGSDDGPLRPVITRDEFKTVEGQGTAYEAIMEACESLILDAIEKTNSRRKDSTMKSLEDALSSALSQMSREERKKRDRDDLMADPEGAQGEGDPIANGDETYDQLPPMRASPPELQTPPPPRARKEKAEPEKEPEKRPPSKVTRRLRVDDFRVRLVRGLSKLSRGQEPPRSALAGNEILVDVTHEDFQSRFKKSRGGAHKVDERLCGYLANVVASHFQDASYAQFDEEPQSRMEAYADLIRTYCRLEERLREVLPQLAKEMAKFYADDELGEPE